MLETLFSQIAVDTLKWSLKWVQHCLDSVTRLNIFGSPYVLNSVISNLYADIFRTPRIILRTSFKGPPSQKGETSEDSVDISTIYSTYFNAFQYKEVHCWLLLVSVLYYPYLKQCIFFDVFYTEALCWNHKVAYSKDIVPAGKLSSFPFSDWLVYHLY